MLEHSRCPIFLDVQGLQPQPSSQFSPLLPSSSLLVSNTCLGHDDLGGDIYSYVFLSNPSFPCSSLSHPSDLIFSESLSQSPQLWVPSDFLCTGSLHFCGFLPVPCYASFLCKEDLPFKLRNALWAAPPFFLTPWGAECWAVQTPRLQRCWLPYSFSLY